MNTQATPSPDDGAPAPDLGNHEMMGHEMANVIVLGEGAYPDAKDGDHVETQVKGVIVEEGGMRHLHVLEADGVPVMEIEEEGEPTDESMKAESESAGNNLRAALAERAKTNQFV